MIQLIPCIVAIQGCYLSHERAGHDAGASSNMDASALDAGSEDSAVDAGGDAPLPWNVLTVWHCDFSDGWALALIASQGPLPCADSFDGPYIVLGTNHPHHDPGPATYEIGATGEFRAIGSYCEEIGGACASLTEGTIEVRDLTSERAIGAFDVRGPDGEPFQTEYHAPVCLELVGC